MLFTVKSYSSVPFGTLQVIGDTESSVRCVPLGTVLRTVTVGDAGMELVQCYAMRDCEVAGMGSARHTLLPMSAALAMAGTQTEFGRFLATINEDQTANYAKAAPRAVISQPMAGRSNADILEVQAAARAALSSMGYTVINTYFIDDWNEAQESTQSAVVSIPLNFLARSIDRMSRCHAAYFCAGWQDARGCRAERMLADEYGLKVLYEGV